VDEEAYYAGKRRAAEAAGLHPDAFMAAWRDTAADASVGRLRSPFDRAQRALESLGVRDRPAIVQVANLDIETIQTCVFFYDGAQEALGELRQRGFRLGLISNATATTAFAVTPLKLRERLDLLTFSYEVGAAKPDPAIYRAALRRSGCPAQEALFVGDGANRELDAAQALGFAVLCMDHALKAHSFRKAELLSSEVHPKVSDFGQLLALPELAAPLIPPGPT
jgi:HAD superfamily hydrolase (TIGR01549 family)